jgi:hypothetical protein
MSHERKILQEKGKIGTDYVTVSKNFHSISKYSDTAADRLMLA